MWCWYCAGPPSRGYSTTASPDAAMTDLLPTPMSVTSVDISDNLRQRVQTPLLDTRAPSTRRDYTRAWKAFEA